MIKKQFFFLQKRKGRGRRGKDASGASLDATHLIASDGRHPKGALTVGFPTCSYHSICPGNNKNLYFLDCNPCNSPDLTAHSHFPPRIFVLQ